MTLKTMIEEVTVPPSLLTTDYKQNILSILNKQVSGKCTNETGYIIKAHDVNKILDNKIGNSSSDIIVSVEFSIEVFKPCVNNKCECTIESIFDDGIFADIMGIQKILIPNSTYKNTLVFEHGKLRTPDGKSSLENGSEITVRIKAVRYNDHSFSCIGELA